MTGCTIGHNNVDLAKLVQGCRDDLLDIWDLGGVRLYGDCSVSAHLIDKVVGCFLVRVVVDHHFCSIGDGSLGYGLSDTLGPSGDDEDFAA